jgi:hypothetical protein
MRHATRTDLGLRPHPAPRPTYPPGGHGSGYWFTRITRALAGIACVALVLFLAWVLLTAFFLAGTPNPTPILP